MLRRPHWLRAACLTMPLALTAAVQLIELHGPDGQRFFVNTHDIASLREPTGVDMRRYFAAGAKCIVVATSGKFIATIETCPTIRDMLRSDATR